MDYHMSNAIRSFNESFKMMKVSSTCLDAHVGDKLKECNTIAELQELQDCLPPNYRGKRRIIQKILEVMGEECDDILNKDVDTTS